MERNKTFVQAFVSNISTPKSIEELWKYITEREEFDIESVLYNSEVSWTAPRWAKAGDIVFFMHAKTGNVNLAAVRKQLLIENSKYGEEEKSIMLRWIEKGLKLHKIYGGKIFAIACVNNSPEWFAVDGLHWGSHIYADMGQITLLKEPVDISEFNAFLKISRMSGITPIFGDTFERMKTLILKKNRNMSDFFLKATDTPLPLTKINDKNWLALANTYRRAFLWEEQYRSYYVNYFLKVLSDRKTIYRECRCIRDNRTTGFVDNAIFLNGKYLLVEVKLAVSTESDIFLQLQKYCQVNKVVLDNKGRIASSEDLYADFVLVIDTEFLYLYNHQKCALERLTELDNISEPKQIAVLKEEILMNLN